MSVGLEIAIEKRCEDKVSAKYVFRVREGRGGLVAPDATGRAGTVKVIKTTGEVVLEEPCPDDTGDVHGQP